MLLRRVAVLGRWQGKPVLEVFEKIRSAGYARQSRVAARLKGFSLWAETRVRPRTTARDWDAEFAVLYELSRGLHRNARWRAERFGPIRISPLQCGHRHVELATSVGRASGGFGTVVSRCRASASNADRRVFARMPNCRMRTKPRGRMCWVKRRRNSVASRVIFRCLFPCA